MTHSHNPNWFTAFCFGLSLIISAALAAEDLTKLKAANHLLDTATETLAAVIVERAMEAAMQRRGLM